MNEIRDKDNSDPDAAGETQPGAGETEDEVQPEPDSDAEKKRLEVEKLRVEIKEIRSRTHGFSTTVRNWSGIAGLLVTVISLFAAGAGLYYGYHDFRTRSEIESDRQARQLDFEVGREIIELSQNLSASDKTKRTNAAILLSAYEEHSVPILVASLHTQDQALADAIIRSLGLILEKPRLRGYPGFVANPLIEETESLFASELKKADPNTLTMTTFVGAIRELFAGSRNQAVLASLQRLEALLQQSSQDVARQAKLANLARKIATARSAVAGA